MSELLYIQTITALALAGLYWSLKGIIFGRYQDDQD